MYLNKTYIILFFENKAFVYFVYTKNLFGIILEYEFDVSKYMKRLADRQNHTSTPSHISPECQTGDQ